MPTPIKKLSVSLIKRNAVKRGPTSSDAWNDTVEETAQDLTRIVNQWNDALWPLLSVLPDGTNDLNAFSSGLDGRVLYVDRTATGSVANTNYWNGTQTRPNSVKEQFEHVYTKFITLKSELLTEISNASGALTDAQKERIGINIFTGGASSSTSLDGKSENTRLNAIQLAKDLYGPTWTLDNDGNTNLVNSVKAMVDALLQLHNGAWDNDITLSHSSLGDFKSDGSVPMTGSVKLADGTAASPSLTFNTDTSQNTGLFKAAEDQIGLAVGGVHTLTFGSAGNEITAVDGILNLNGWLVTNGGGGISSSGVLRQSLGYFGNTLNGDGAVAHIFDTLNNYFNPGFTVPPKLISVRNNGVEQWDIDFEGYAHGKALITTERLSCGDLSDDAYFYTDTGFGVGPGTTRIRTGTLATGYAELYMNYNGGPNNVSLVSSAPGGVAATFSVDSNGDAQMSGVSGLVGIQALSSGAGLAFNKSGVVLTSIDALTPTIHNTLDISEEGFLFRDQLTADSAFVNVDGVIRAGNAGGTIELAKGGSSIGGVYAPDSNPVTNKSGLELGTSGNGDVNLYNQVADVIITEPGEVRLDSASGQPIVLNAGGATGNVVVSDGRLQSAVGDGATAIAFRLAAASDYTTSGAKILSVGDDATGTYSEKMSVDKDGFGVFAAALRIGTTSDTTNGNIRYTGTDFEARKGGSWVSMTGAGSVSNSTGSSTDNAIARYDGTTGNLVQNSIPTVDDAGLIKTQPGGASGSTMTVGGCLHVNATEVGNPANSSENDLMSYTLPASVLDANGKTLRITMSGRSAVSASGTSTLRIKFGSATILTRVLPPAASRCWVMEFDVTRTGSSAQAISYVFTDINNDSDVITFIEGEYTTTSQTDTSTIVIKATAEQSASQADSIKQQRFIVELAN